MATINKKSENITKERDVYYSQLLKLKQKSMEIRQECQPINIEDIDKIMQEIDDEKCEILRSSQDSEGFSVILKKYETFNELLQGLDKAKNSIQSIFEKMKEIT